MTAGNRRQDRMIWPFWTAYRRIASYWHGGQGSGLYAFSSTGREIPRALQEAKDTLPGVEKAKDRAQLEGLIRFLERHALNPR